MSSKKIATNVQKAAVVESNAVEAPAPIETSKDFVTIASHMPQGIIFTDIPSKDGGTKTVEIPSYLKRTGRTSSACTAVSAPFRAITGSHHA